MFLNLFFYIIFFIVTKILYISHSYLQGHQVKKRILSAYKSEFPKGKKYIKNGHLFCPKSKKKIYFWNFEKKHTLKE